MIHDTIPSYRIHYFPKLYIEAFLMISAINITEHGNIKRYLRKPGASNDFK